MEIVKLNLENQHIVLARAREIIDRGGTIVYPTETAYGLGGDLFSDKAYGRIISIKKRPADKMFPVIVADLIQATSLVQFHQEARELAEKYWPGPLTLVLPLSVTPVNNLFPGTSLALRVSSHPIAADLARIVSKPLIATSANISGMPAAYTIKDFLDQLKGRSILPDLVIDIGPLPQSLPSTIVSFVDNAPKILRQGSVTIDYAS